MFSKYLDYSETATLTHRISQEQSERKDITIGQLKSEVKELKQLEGDFQKLNDLITSLEAKYSLLNAERQRSSKEQRLKTDIDKKNILDLRQEIDSLRVQLQTHNLQIDDLLRDNTNLKRQTDMRNSQIQNIRYQLKQLDNKNARNNDQNRSLVITVKGLKQERKSLQQQCEQLSNLLDTSMTKIKNTEKDVRTVESANTRLQKTLYQAEKDHQNLQVQTNQKSDEIKRSQQKLKGIQGSIADLQITYRNLEQASLKSKAEIDRNISALNSEIAKGRDLQATISEVEAAIKAEQNNLDIIIAQEQRLRKEQFAGLQKNKRLNLEIDHILSLIAEYESVNKQLLQEIELFIDQDQRARSVLNRRQLMHEIIESTNRKVSLTQEPIKHLRY